MCRIAGIISERLPIAEIAEKVRTMCNTLAHGGPDDEGLFIDANAKLVFGHRRLSIIDLSSRGHQPMADAEKKAWITFNGEIYNYRELKAELTALGGLFYSDTDTEVIIQAYLHWGVHSFSKLKGMFAFALYDVANAFTYLVRDTTGIKPLYYHTDSGQLSFASEVDAFKTSGITNITDNNWQIRLLAFGHVPEPYTTLKNVHSLKKAHYLRWEHKSSTFKTACYQQEETVQGRITDSRQASEFINKTLRAAITRQLIADAPIGVFLSGGIDSSLVTLLAAEQKKARLKTISVYFNEKEYDESAFQQVVLKKVAGDKVTHLVQQADFDLLFPKIMSAMDMPTTDGINTWFISKYAHDDGLKAVLSGLGADELFGGYPSFTRIKYLRYLRKIPSAAFTLANYFKTDKYKKISFLAHNTAIADYLLLRGLFVPQDIAKILNADMAEVEEVLFNGLQIPKLGTYDAEHAAWFENNLYMQNQLLRDTDVMSMSHGLEVRVPFLDEELQSLAGLISPAIRFSNAPPKKILIDSFKDVLPQAIWNRPKMGFTFPLQTWMSEHPQISDEHLYKGKNAREAVQKFKKGQMHWSKIFALYQIQQLND